MKARTPDGEDAELAAAAEEELEIALTLGWTALAAVIPWGDSFTALGPRGGDVRLERAYLWDGAPGGPIRCEVTARRGVGDAGAAVRAGLILRPR